MVGKPDTQRAVEHDASVCVVVPVFNEEPVIGAVVVELRRSFANVVCVDDGSTDSSAAVAHATGATVLRHPVNLGQGAALQTGISYALTQPNVTEIVTFDADGQHQVDDAVRMTRQRRLRGRDVLLGSRSLGSATGLTWGRRQTLRAALLYTRLTTGLALTDTHNGLRVLSRDAASRLVLKQPGMAHASELLSEIARLRLTYEEYPVSVAYTEYSRGKGQTNLNAVNILSDLFLAKLRPLP